MKKHKYPKIQTRLFIGLLIIILSSSSISVFYFKDIKELNKLTNDIVEHPFIVSNSVRDIDIYINVMYRSMKEILLSKNDIELNKAINLVNKNEQLIYDKFEIVKEKFLGDLKFVNEAYTAFVESKPIRDEVIDLVKNGNIDEAEKTIKEKGNYHKILLLNKTHKMIDYANKKAASFNQNSIFISQKAKRKSILFFISSSILGIVMFLWIFYSISNPINKMINRIIGGSEDTMNGFPKNTSNQLAVLDFAISEFENREKILAEKVKERTNELEETRNILDRSIENAAIGITTTNFEGRLIKVNNTFCDFIGYTREELLNMKFNDITKEQDKAKSTEYIKRVIEGKAKGKSFVKVYIHKSGDLIYGSVSSSLVKDRNDQPLSLFNQIKDITKQKQYEIKIEKHKIELEDNIKYRTIELDEKAQKLEKSQRALTFLLEDVSEIKKQLEVSNLKLNESNNELESFSYSVSHDLKAPLRAVTGFSQILIEDYSTELSDEAKRYLALIINNADNMGTLINDLLSFSRMGRKELKKSEFNMLDIITRIKSDLKAEIQDRKLKFKIQQMPLVNADEKLMYHVMLNLISNAVKFTSKIENASVELGCNSINNENVFYVKDNGVGFNMKYAGKVFDVFQRLHTSEEFPGTGIGLSIVQKIIRKHGGKVWIESEKNKGATVFFTLK